MELNYRNLFQLHLTLRKYDLDLVIVVRPTCNLFHFCFLPDEIRETCGMCQPLSSFTFISKIWIFTKNIDNFNLPLLICFTRLPENPIIIREKFCHQFIFDWDWRNGNSNQIRTGKQSELSKNSVFVCKSLIKKKMFQS